MIPADLVIRRLESTDSITDLTALLHLGYRDLARQGLRFVASHQDDTITRRRVSLGECHVAVSGGTMIGTINYIAPGRKDLWYARPGVATFSQFCVEPDFRGSGLGSRLLSVAEARAIEDGATSIACDTAEPATDLIGWYHARGYRTIGHIDHRPVTNYRSVVLAKPLAGESDQAAG